MSVIGDILAGLTDRAQQALDSQGLTPNYVSRRPINLEDIPSDQFPHVAAIPIDGTGEALDYSQTDLSFLSLLEIVTKTAGTDWNADLEAVYAVFDEFRRRLQTDPIHSFEPDPPGGGPVGLYRVAVRTFTSSWSVEAHPDSPFIVLSIVTTSQRAESPRPA